MSGFDLLKRVDPIVARLESIYSTIDSTMDFLSDSTILSLNRGLVERLFLSLGRYETNFGKDFKHKDSDYGFIGVNAWWQKKRASIPAIRKMAAVYLLPSTGVRISNRLKKYTMNKYMNNMEAFKNLPNKEVAAARMFWSELIDFYICYSEWLFITTLSLKKTKKIVPMDQLHTNFINWWVTGDINESASRVLLTSEEVEKQLSAFQSEEVVK